MTLVNDAISFAYICLQKIPLRATKMAFEYEYAHNALTTKPISGK